MLKKFFVFLEGGGVPRDSNTENTLSYSFLKNKGFFKNIHYHIQDTCVFQGVLATEGL